VLPGDSGLVRGVLHGHSAYTPFRRVHAQQGTRMKLKQIALAIALAASGSAFAANGCTKTFNLGSMGPPADRAFASGYFTAGNFSDCYDFTLQSPATATGTTTEWSFNFAGLLGLIDVMSVQLFGLDSSNQRVNLGYAADTSPANFSFSNMAAGAYELVIGGTTTQGLLATVVAYSGELHTRSSTTVAAPVPEPQLYAMMALGLVAAGVAARRRRS
jgi:PEP-CTERM motif